MTGIIEENKSKIAQLEQCLSEKEEIITELRRSNDQLTDTLRQYSDMTEKMKADSRKRDEEIQAADVEKFQLISEYVIFNYRKYIDNKKAVELARLSAKIRDRRNVCEGNYEKNRLSSKKEIVIFLAAPCFRKKRVKKWRLSC